MNKIKLYYKIYYNNAYNYDIQNMNYIILNNIKEISNYNEKIVNQINGMMNEVQINKNK